MESAPNEYGGETDRVAVQKKLIQSVSDRKDTAVREDARATHIHPVIKQYAARGIVDRSGLTWVMR